MAFTCAEALKFLQVATDNGIDGKSLVMIGKQDMDIHSRNFLKTLSKIFPEVSSKLSEIWCNSGKIDSVKFFEAFGFGEVHALDYSDYEGADIVFDLNKNLPANLKERFDYVINGGTLEHVFNISQALSNISQMVNRGGIIMNFSPSDGWVNHGFYSISPLFFEEFYVANGFSLLQLELEFFVNPFDDSSEQHVGFSEDLRLLNTASIEMYMNAFLKNREFRRAQVVCFAKRDEICANMKFPIQGMYQRLYEDNHGETINYIQAAKDIGTFKGKQALYGSGYMCEKILNEIFRIDSEDNILGIFNSNIEKAGTYFRGYKILYPTQKKLLAVDRIFISSIDYEDEIYESLREKGVPGSKIAKIADFHY